MAGMLRQFMVLEVTIIATILLLAPVQAFSSPTGSLKAELFHREHTLSPYRSLKHVTDQEKVKVEVQRSSQRAQNLNSRGRRRRGTQNNGTNLQIIVTNGAPCEYLMSISVGTPPQNFYAVADTGSDLTWLQCSPCEVCFNQTSPVFDPSLSSTYGNLSCSSTGCKAFVSQYWTGDVPYCQNEPSSVCEYEYFYGDGSNTTGAFSSENMFLDKTSNPTLTDFWFGCSHASITPSGAYDFSNGLVGLGQGTISLPSQLGSSNIPDMFSYCLVNRSVTSFLSSSLVFGQGAVSYVPSEANSALQYTPILNVSVSPLFYYLSLEGISVDGVLLNVDPSDFAVDYVTGDGGTIIDSGTTYTSLPPMAMDLLLTAVDSSMPYHHVYDPNFEYLELCYNVTGVPDFGLKGKLPSISFKFANSSSWDLAAQNTWVNFNSDSQYSAGSDLLCLAITRGSSGDGSIFGNYQQQDFHVLYDRINSRLGFARTDCARQS